MAADDVLDGLPQRPTTWRCRDASNRTRVQDRSFLLLSNHALPGRGLLKDNSRDCDVCRKNSSGKRGGRNKDLRRAKSTMVRSHST